jgi:RNA polymerase sigma-70 factor (ECF subfamily)
MRTDEELAREVQRGDRAAAEELLRRHQEPLFALARRWVRVREDAEEVVQETMTRTLSHIQDWDPARPFAPWLYRIARNLAFDRLRRGGRTVPLVGPEEGPEPAADPDWAQNAADEHLHQDHVRRGLREAVAELPPLYRNALLLYHGQGLTYREMSARTGEPEGTLMNRLFRARRKLEEALRRKGIEP